MDGDSTWGWEGEGARRLCRPRMAWATQAFDPSLWDLKPGQSFLQMQTYLSANNFICHLNTISYRPQCTLPGDLQTR